MKGSVEFQHHMLKEIFEQPDAVAKTVQSLASDNGLLDTIMPWPLAELKGVARILIAGSGSSRHAGIAGKSMIEALARIPVDVGFSSELQYSQVAAGPETLVVVITQSGETTDTLGALRVLKRSGVRVLAISNVADASIMREADARVHTKAGPELAIPSTKAFAAQLAALFVFAVWLAKTRGTITGPDANAHIHSLQGIPGKLKATLDISAKCQAIAQKHAAYQDFFFAGRGVHYAAALDGALKLKEVSYMHAEAFPTGEIPHGPLALVDENVTTIIIATRDENDSDSRQRYQQTLGNIQDIKSRSGRVIAVANEPEPALCQAADEVIEIPTAPELLLPILEIVPLQLFAYYTAALHGRDVDSPRNLTKAVITE